MPDFSLECYGYFGIYIVDQKNRNPVIFKITSTNTNQSTIIIQLLFITLYGQLMKMDADFSGNLSRC